MAGRRELADAILERRSQALAQAPVDLEEPDSHMLAWPMAIASLLGLASMLVDPTERRSRVLDLGAGVLGWLEAIERENGAAG